MPLVFRFNNTTRKPATECEVFKDSIGAQSLLFTVIETTDGWKVRERSGDQYGGFPDCVEALVYAIVGGRETNDLTISECTDGINAIYRWSYGENLEGGTVIHA